MLSDLRNRFLFQTIRFIIPVIASLALKEDLYAQSIDKFKLVNRHNVTINQLDALAPLAVGNGNFSFTADVTGLQSFEQLYLQKGLLLETKTTWARHTYTDAGVSKNRMNEFGPQDRNIGHPIQNENAQKADDGHNDHPLPLGQIGLVKRDNNAIELSSLTDIHQKLDIWRGIITSSYRLSGQLVVVETLSSPDKSMVAFSLSSPLLKRSGIKTSFRFPYSYNLTTKNTPSLNWSKPDLHTTDLVRQSKNSAVLKRSIGETSYYVGLSWKGNATLVEVANHQFYLEASGDKIEVVCEFSATPTTKPQPDFSEVKRASKVSWKEYWTRNAIADAAEFIDAPSQKLEKQLILSKYFMKINNGDSVLLKEKELTHVSR